MIEQELAEEQMVRAVIGDQVQLDLAEEQISRSGVTPQVGLVIGKLSHKLDRGFIYSLISTPQNDAGDPACSLVGTSIGEDHKKKGAKSKSVSCSLTSLAIDCDWVAEHARQVARMMVGGVKVIGIYVWAGELVFKNSAAGFCQTLMSVSKAASLTNTRVDESLLLHISNSPRRWTCRNFISSSSTSSSNLRPCEFKTGKVLNYLQIFKSDYNFELRLPITHESSNTLGEILREAIFCHEEDLKEANVLVDGNFVLNEESLTADEQPRSVEFISPFMKSALLEGFEEVKEKDVSGTVILSGAVAAFSCSNTKEPLSEAVADVKSDIITTLRSRVDTMCEAKDGEEQAIGKAMGNEKWRLPFPRRVLIRWVGCVLICDYLLPNETPEAVVDHCKELFSMEMTNVIEAEAEAEASGKTSSDAADVSKIAVSGSNSSQNVFLGNFAVFSALIFLLSLIIGFVIFSRR